ncbi:tyrosine-type recombinase/integrase [Chitinophaga sp. ARDCPP14]|uniref:site-specific integrase n=1 Tax=Chitinophaga sp. ARDCPP14 TaxID=3391139 RepID=UPI003F52560D
MDSDTPQIIYLIARWNGNRLVYSTELSVKPKHWSTKAHEVRNIIQELNRDTINSHLKNLKAETIRVYATAVEKRETVTKELIKEKLDDFTRRNDQPEKHFWGFLESFIKNSDKRFSKNGKLISKRTIQKYNVFSGLLKDFEKASRRHIDFYNIDIEFYNDLKEYLTQVKQMKVNTIGGHIATLKMILSEAATAGIANINTERIKRSFKVITENTTAVYLPENELQNIAAFDLKDNQRLIRARDLFLIGCYTGLRVSDFMNIQPHNIKGEFIELFQTKTGGKVIIPIHATVKEILKKYGGNTPARMSDQKLNEYIKELCQLVKLTEKIEIQVTKAGIRTTEVFEKWQLITNHTARRSFATNMYKMGIPAQTIMKITGHIKEAVFLKYIKLSEQEHANIMRDMWKARKPKQAAKKVVKKIVKAKTVISHV